MSAAESAASHPTNPENRLGIDYRSVPQTRSPGPIIDAHTHVYSGPQADVFFESARLYGVTHVMSMSPLAEVPELRDRFGDELSFIAIPNWRKMNDSEDSRREWMDDLSAFRKLHGAKLCKFWMAPLMRERHGWTVDHPFLRPIVNHAVSLGYNFLIHVADPTVWFAAGKQYADASKFGSKTDQYPQLEWLCDYVSPRIVIAAHMGGNVEDPVFLQGLLDRHANLRLDSSATKWIVREVARHPEAVREFVERNADRIVFGSDVVASTNYTRFDHFASRYWAHRMMWESDYRGESPIEDPDANPPMLAGLSLSPGTLRKLYFENMNALGFAGRDRSVSA